MSDDFTSISGLVEGTAAAFANSWKTSASCLDITLTFGNPCILSYNKGTASLSSCDLCIHISGDREYCFITILVLLFLFNQKIMPSFGAPN